MQHDSGIARYWAWLAGLAFVLMAGCGGGGGGGETQSPPYVFASLTSFPTNGVPPGFVGAGLNSSAIVDVLNNSTGAPIPNAAVTLNGIALSYDPVEQYYSGELVVDPAQALVLRVTVNGVTYTCNGTQLTSYPTITSPGLNATWSASADNLVGWSGTAPATPSLYAVGILDDNGFLVWPPSGIALLPTSASSTIVGAGSLGTGNRLVLVGLATEFDMPGAAAGSSMVAFGLNQVPISVSAGPIATLVSISLTPSTATLSPGGTLQFSATGTYSDSSTRDLTAQVTWSSSDTGKATIDTAGIATGVGFGAATITAALGPTSGAMTLNVFQPTPSPVPPLSQSVAYQIDYAHSGFVTFGTALNFPSNPTWSVTLGGLASYPLIADGRVFVISAFPGVPSLYALDKATGTTLWGPVAVGGTWAGHSYDNGKIFTIEYGGMVRAFHAGTGQLLWSAQMPFQWIFTSPPTAKDGVVYVSGAGSAGTVFAVDQSNGNLLWSAGVWNGDHSSPAVSGEGLFVSYPCQVYKFHPFTGASLWRYNGPCQGGGGRTSAYANGKLYVRNPGTAPVAPVFDAATGTIVGDFASGAIPAFSGQAGYALNSGTLRAVDLASNSEIWNFSGDGQLVLAPVIIDNRVIVGSATGNVYALDAVTGVQVWSSSAGAGIEAPDEHNPASLSGFGAGEGYLVVPAGSTVSAWHLSGP